MPYHGRDTPARVRAGTGAPSLEELGDVDDENPHSHAHRRDQGFAAVRTGGSMIRNGVDLQDGGGWAALMVTEVCASFAAVAVALW